MCLERLRSISPAGDHIHRATSCQCKDRRDYCLFRFDLKWEKWHIWSRIIMWPLKKINFHSVTESGQLSDYTKNIIRGLNRYFSWIWPFLPLSLMRITRELSFLCCNDWLIRMSPDEDTPLHGIHVIVFSCWATALHPSLVLITFCHWYQSTRGWWWCDQH